ncbi:MAG: 50S ribosomal protein L15 [Candidatus Kapabacteria bacterium]|nr:50S ribosomal protein L15 [Candidatus Kapabacteria bacterium]
MKHVGNLKYAEGSKHSKKRIGRGPGSGHGGTSTQGHKGQQSRSGAKSKRGFEGGQMPISRRLPKFGFTNPTRIEYQSLNVGAIQEFISNKRIESNNITFEILFLAGIINKPNLPLKILGNGEINVAITIEADGFSSSAKEKIEKAGGTVIING